MSYFSRLMAQRGVRVEDVLDEMRFLTNEKLGPNQSLTPEGFLLIKDTPIARTGWQIYAPQEIPLDLYPDFAPPPDGVFRVRRDDDDVFSADTMASANGKPVVDEHPQTILTPDNCDGAPGVVMSVRRGEGALDDLMIADLIIYNKDLINLIRDGKRELSCGYDVDYEELAPGRLAQKNIRINHVALVDSGRCGPRCSIGDRSQPAEEVRSMAKTNTKKKVGDVFDAFRRALMGSTTLSAKDKEELEKAIKKEEDELPEELKEHEFKPDHDAAEGTPASGHHIEVHTHMPPHPVAAAAEHDDDEEGDIEERVARLETAVHEIAEMVRGLGSGGERSTGEATTDEPDASEEGKAILGQLELEAPPGAEATDVRGAKDSRFLVDSFQATSAIAEVLAPGIRLPAFDGKTDPKKNFKVICDLRRSALDLAFLQADTRGMIEEILAGRAFDAKKMTCDAVRGTFLAVGAMKKHANNQTIRAGDVGVIETRAHGQPAGGIKSLRDLQKVYDEHYKRAV